MREAPRRDDRKEESQNSRAEEKGKSGIKARKADEKQPSAFKNCVAEDKEKDFLKHRN